MDDILTKRNLTQLEAREAALAGGLALAIGQPIIEYMGRHMLHLRKEQLAPLRVIEEVRDA
jgi:hypothetical protein